MNNLFDGCTNLEKIIFGKNFITDRVSQMSYMFANCVSLTELNLTNFNTGYVSTMKGMFYSCTKLTYIDLSSFDTRRCTNYQDMFANINSIKVKADKSQGDKLIEYLKTCKNVVIVE